jgi:hypothetical protein
VGGRLHSARANTKVQPCFAQQLQTSVSHFPNSMPRLHGSLSPSGMLAEVQRLSALNPEISYFWA